jgi:hypothetical protein
MRSATRENLLLGGFAQFFGAGAARFALSVLLPHLSGSPSQPIRITKFNWGAAIHNSLCPFAQRHVTRFQYPCDDTP